MSEETAMRALDIAFTSPAARIKIEFQGGESLSQFSDDQDDCSCGEAAVR
jgi:hypothetical protein